jgi:acetate kinase
MLEAARLLKKPASKLKLITAHLGGGSSITAIDRGVAVDTSMGFTPLEGLVMGTRSGDLDLGIIFYLADKAKLSLRQIKDILVNESGIYGLCGARNMLELLQRVRKKDPKAKLAFAIFVYRIQKYIGAYAAILGGCDGLVFTGAVGAGDSLTRNTVTRPLRRSVLKNTKILRVLPNEEKMIARETVKVTSNK